MSGQNELPAVVTYRTSLGPIEATKDAQGSPWHIGHPWGDEIFYGDRAALKARCRAIVKKNETEDA